MKAKRQNRAMSVSATMLDGIGGQVTGVNLDEAITTLLTDVSIDDLRRFCDELESAFQLSQDMPPQASVT